MNHEEEFYIGYEPQAPVKTASFVRRLTVALLFITLAVAAILVSGQHRFATSVFEYGQIKDFEGIVRAQPYPTLIVERPGQTVSASNYLLVGTGKHGADPEVKEFDHQKVRLRGSLIYRDGTTMIELLPRSIEILPDQSGIKQQSFNKDPLEDLGEVTLTGEIVDSKCYLGVMNPGSAKPHQDCAVRCISGGAPPLFIAQDQTGKTLHFLLTDENGEALNQSITDFVAEPLRIAGHAYRDGDQLILRAAQRTYQRIE